MYEKRYQEGYDVPDPEYEAWLKITHPIETSSVAVCRSTTPAGACFTETSSASSAFKSTGSAGSSNSVLSGSKCSDILEEFLVLPKPKPTTTRKTKKGLNSKTICITEDKVLKELKEREAERLAKQEEKERKRLEKEENKRFEFKKLVGRPRPWKLESLGNRLRRTLLVEKTLR